MVLVAELLRVDENAKKNIEHVQKRLVGFNTTLSEVENEVHCTHGYGNERIKEYFLLSKNAL